MEDTAQVVPATEAPAPEATQSNAAPVERPERDPNRVYTQAEMDRIVEKAKKNERYRTRKETEAFYQGRESVRAPAEKPAPEAKPEAKVDAPQPPKREDFSDYEQWHEAKSAFVAEQAVARLKAQDEKERAEKKAEHDLNEKRRAFQAKAREKYGDIETRLESISEISLPEEALSEISDSEVGPDILVYLADNPKECERIAALTPSAARREIVKLEARLESQAAPEKPKTSKPSNAPEPISPVGGRASVNDDAPKGTDTGDAYRAKRMRELAARKGQRTGTH